MTGQNGTDKMVQTKWYKQNGTDKMVAISIDSNSTELNFYSVTTSHKQVIRLNGSKWKRD